MRILVVGLGSMGKRRIRLLRQNYPLFSICGADRKLERRVAVVTEFQIDVFESAEQALQSQNFDCAFICAAPLAHAEIISLCLKNGLHVFTELNLVDDGYNTNIELAQNYNRVLFLSSTFLYRDEIQILIKYIIESKSILQYSYHVGQYLPDWHPWEDFKSFFVGNKRTNGCREILAVELPWLLKAFGPVKETNVKKLCASSLELDYPDAYQIIIHHESGHCGQLMVDVVTRVPVRHFEVFGEDLQLEWRGKPEELWRASADYNRMEKIDLTCKVSRTDGYRDFIVENAYLREIETFFSVCANGSKSLYTFEDDKYTLSLIDQIEA